MPRRRLLFAGLAVLAMGAVALWACRDRLLTLDAVEAGVRRAYPEVPTVSTDEVARRLADSTAPPLLLDARQPDEFAVSHLPGARRVDPDATAHDLAASLADVPADREIVVYCSVGYRSAGVAERLKDAGYADVSNLEGSIFRWANEGRPLVREGTPTDLVHPYDTAWGRLLEAERRAPLPD